MVVDSRSTPSRSTRMVWAITCSRSDSKSTYMNWDKVKIEDHRSEYATLDIMKHEYEKKKRHIVRLEIICWIRRYFLRDLLDIMDGNYKRVIEVIERKKIDRIMDIEATQLRALKDLTN